MTSGEFLQQLAQHLQCLSEDERANAMAYYHEYFEEAGEENETQAVESLGSPQSVAERIIKEVGVVDTAESPKPTSATQYQYDAPKSIETVQYQYDPQAEQGSNGSVSGGRIILAVVILLLTSPFWIAVPIVWFSIVMTLLLIPVIFLMAAVLAPIQGILGIVNGMTAAGLVDLGGGVLMLGLLLLLWYPCVMGAWNLTKLFGKLCVAVFNLLTGKEKH